MPKQEDLSNVPASVIKQQREAEKLIKQAEEGPAQELNTDQDPPEPASPVEPAAPTAIQTSAEPAINDGSTDDGQWKHKYDVLQGKYNKEISDLKGTVVDMQAMLERQEVVIQGLNSQQSEKAPSQVNLTDLNPEDFEGWGDEMKVMVNQVNSLKTIINDQNKIISDLKNTKPSKVDDSGLASRVETLETEAQDSRVVSYLKYLDDNIKGNWRALNKDVNFINWASDVDPISLQPRLNLLQQAAGAFRGAQVASIFNAYISEVGGSSGYKVDAELPGSGPGGEFTPSNEPKLTQDDVTKAQSDFVKGRITEEEFDNIYKKFQKTLRR